ncbi:hypothetical protein N431DRAFT_494314 [Stipitochalara longipes BDJ]|nr:hypothetical protein N431DRAFT_494314 [Stipitochalara longipes BDJ]
MGLWAKGTHRKFKLQEFRYEVVYETPIFFTSHPANSRGPIQGREIHYVDGSEHSYKNTRVLGPIADRKLEAERNARTDTADDERASWLTLLSVLQLEEVRSRQWDWDYRNETPPRSYTPAIQAPDYPLAVGIQSKTSSWDFVPASINKPYATTAVCHLIEMMGMVGVYWKLFDAITWNLRAEGNGLFLISRMAPDLGIYVIFGISGKMRFEENRVIPTMALKELCFGIVPNIFEDGFYLDRNRDAKSLVLNFGGHDSVLTTLESLGCHSNTLKQWKRGHSHIFSVSFEIIGMLSQVFRIRGSNFRMIPNPTQDPWLKCPGSKMSWKMARLLEMFRHKTIELVEKEEVLFEENVRIIRQIAELEQWTSDERGLSTEIREAIHDEIDVISQYLLRISQREVLSVVSAHISKVTAALDDPGSPLNSLDLANKEEAMMSFYFYEIRPAVTRKHEKSKPPLTKVERQRRNNIWIALVFRMLCWLTLHDFDANDVNIVPSELRGSRIPVYIG